MFTDQSCYILLKSVQHIRRNLNYAEKENLTLRPKCADDVHKALGTLHTKLKNVRTCSCTKEKVHISKKENYIQCGWIDLAYHVIRLIFNITLSGRVRTSSTMLIQIPLAIRSIRQHPIKYIMNKKSLNCV